LIEGAISLMPFRFATATISISVALFCKNWAVGKWKFTG